jgi:hypothetical protein
MSTPSVTRQTIIYLASAGDGTLYNAFSDRGLEQYKPAKYGDLVVAAFPVTYF